MVSVTRHCLRVGKDESGALSLPLVLFFSIAMTFGLGTWALFHRWGTLAETQLRLDRCTGEAAQNLRKALERTQTLNRAIRAARLTLAGGALVPGGSTVAAAAKEALQVAYVAQEAILASWKVRQGLWALRGCAGMPGVQSPLPSMPWTRDPPDPLGPNPLRWTGSDRLRIQAARSPRKSAALLKGELSDENGPKNWKLEWTRPGLL